MAPLFGRARLPFERGGTTGCVIVTTSVHAVEVDVFAAVPDKLTIAPSAGQRLLANPRLAAFAPRLAKLLASLLAVVGVFLRQRGRLKPRRLLTRAAELSPPSGRNVSLGRRIAKRE